MSKSAKSIKKLTSLGKYNAARSIIVEEIVTNERYVRILHDEKLKGSSDYSMMAKCCAVTEALYSILEKINHLEKMQ
jgi:hypothetical protein